MKTKIVYVLTSSDKDVYYEEALISAWSARYWNQDAVIILVTDDITNKRLDENSALLSLISEKKVINMPREWNQKQRSREIKTTLREIISGDYLFIDTDTVICSPLDDVDILQGDMYAVFDCHQAYSTSVHFIASQLGKLGVNAIEGESYFNSGVMFVRDTDKSHELYRLWHQKYKESLEKGFSADQASLFAANQKLGYIQELDGIYNCQIFCGGIPWLGDAKIIHAFNNVQSWGHGNPHGEQKYNPNAKLAFFTPADTNFLLKIKMQNGLMDDDKKIILTAKHQFHGEYRLLFGGDLEYYHSALYHVFLQYPLSFRLFDKLGRFLIKIKRIF